MNIGIEYDYEGYMLTTEWDGLISASSRVRMLLSTYIFYN